MTSMPLLSRWRVTLLRPIAVSAVSVFAVASLHGATMRGRDGTGEPPDKAEPRVLVTGEVRYPGRVTLTTSTMTVPDALAAVGSPTVNAGDHVIVVHALTPGDIPERRTIALKDLDLGTAGVDIALHDGDIVNVPAANRFYISGFVRVPGTYRLPPGVTVTQAIALAGGLSDGGTDRHVKIDRVVNGKSSAISAQLGDRVLPNDGIRVRRRMF
jgi:polysaccharide export outer membrane protein